MTRLSCVIAATALSFASSGCSLLFTDAPPKHHEKMVYFDCTSTPGLEVADGVLGVGSILGGVNTLSTPEARFERENDGNDRNGTAAGQFVIAGVFVASAIYGIVVTEGCSDAKADLRQRIIEREKSRAREPARSVPPTPAPLPPPPPAPVTPSTAGSEPLPPPVVTQPGAPSPSPSPAQPAPAPAAPATSPAPSKPGSGSF
jgi:hypothetical protein